MTVGYTDSRKSSKGKDAVVLRMALRRGAHLPFPGHLARRFIYHWVSESTVTFSANGRYQFILLGEQRHIVSEQLAQSRYVKRSGRDSNLRHLQLGCKSNALTTTSQGHVKAVMSDKLQLLYSILKFDRSLNSLLQPIELFLKKDKK